MLKQIIENLRRCASDKFECDECTVGHGNGCAKKLKLRAANTLEYYLEKDINEGWRVADIETPPENDDTDFYLVVCSGKFSGVRLFGSIEIGEWDPVEKKWLLCWLPEVENLKVYAWRPMPTVPEEIKALLPATERELFGI